MRRKLFHAPRAGWRCQRRPKHRSRKGVGPGKRAAAYDPELDRIISEDEAAKIRGVSPDTLKRNSERGGKPERKRLSMRRVGYVLREVLEE
jgi:hypothetical protein